MVSSTLTGLLTLDPLYPALTSHMGNCQDFHHIKQVEKKSHNIAGDILCLFIVNWAQKVRLFTKLCQVFENVFNDDGIHFDLEQTQAKQRLERENWGSFDGVMYILRYNVDDLRLNDTAVWIIVGNGSCLAIDIQDKFCLNVTSLLLFSFK